MKKALISIGFAALVLTACSESEETQEPAHVQSEPEVEETKQEETVDVVKETEEKAKEEVEEIKEETLPVKITLNDFNAKYKQDDEETQYQNGKFQLRDGTVVTADYLMYSENDTFDYAIAVFHEGTLADIQIETSLTDAKLEKSLGVSFSGKNTVVKPYQFGYEITFDSKFDDDNIAVYPNEWD